LDGSHLTQWDFFFYRSQIGKVTKQKNIIKYMHISNRNLTQNLESIWMESWWTKRFTALFFP